MKRVLYLTVDGLLQPLGYSQVVRIVQRLADAGTAYDVLSAERDVDLARPEAVRTVEASLARHGIGWHRIRYDASGGARAAAVNVGSLTRETIRLSRTGRYRLLHARAFHGGAAALAARAASLVPYLYDARSYWIDERLDEGRWFTNPAALGAARLLEHQIFARARSLVTLTELQANDVRGGRFGPCDRPVVCIPTCADYDEFQLGRRAVYRHVPPQVLEALAGKLVVAFVGSLNRSYLVESSAALAARILTKRPDAIVLALSTMRAEYEALFARHGIDPSRTLITRADHWAMPEWLSLIDWGIALLDTTPAKRASVPTKLAEFFAAGVRVLHHGCNSEVSEWVARAGTGWVLPDVTDVSLDAAARHVERSDSADRAGARELTRAHFSLTSAVARYEALVREAGAS